MQTVICMKWGDRYGSDYVNKLYNMVSRSTQRPLRFICLTDDRSGIASEVECGEIPPIDLPADIRVKGWRKLSLWQDKLVAENGPIEGPFLFFDLDIILPGGPQSVDDFFDYMPEETYVVIENWPQKGKNIGNTSVFRLSVGSQTIVYNQLHEKPETAYGTFPNSQTYVSRTSKTMAFWPDEWCVSFKHSLLPPWPLRFFKAPTLWPGIKAVAFTGKPDPDEAAIGVWPEKKPWKKLYKFIKPSVWIDEHWR